MTTILALILAISQAVAQTPDLSGLWTAKQRFGPDARGTLLLTRSYADIAGYRVAVKSEGETLAFELPDDMGKFRGKIVGREIHGHWIQPVTRYSGGRYATPVTLVPDGGNRWRGIVTPLDDSFTFYLPLVRDGAGYRTYLNNPERNLGRFFPISRVELNADSVRLLGDMGEGMRVMTQGILDDGAIWSVRLRGGAYDFFKVGDSTASGFYPRGKPAQRYRYTQPLQLADGWPVATPESVGISRAALEQLVQALIELPMDSLGSQQIHSVLVARHGKLILDEYFHGYSRDLPHEMRSASKSVVSLLVGVTNTPVGAPVYQTMGVSTSDARKRAMTLDHLLNMTAGFECSSDGTVPNTADEDVINQAGVQDWYSYTLNVPLNAAPGEKVFYCSAEPNLAGGMIEKLAGEPQVELFDRLIGRPLQMQRYHLGLQPSGEAYGGGGHNFTSRDFLKLAQLMIDGRWGTKQILPRDFVQRSRAPLVALSARQQYRWLWNSVEYDWNGRKVRGYFAGGNGGQVFMAIPDLDLVIGFTGANYSQPQTFTSQRVYIPQYILPAVR